MTAVHAGQPAADILAEQLGLLAPDAVCVVGMHRSGTSLVTRIMNIVGVALGPADQLMPPHADDNPTGYWENLGIVDLNDRLLRALGGTWDRPPVLTHGWEYSPEVAPLRDEARRLAHSVLSSGSVAGWKDPRMSIVLPFWQTVVPISATIVVVRHPVQVVASLARRDVMRPEQAAHLWSRYMIAAWRSHRNRMVLNYDVALADPGLCAIHLADFLGLEVPSPEMLRDIASFVSTDLRHHDDDFMDAGPNMALALSIYAVMESQPFSMVDRVFDAIHAEWLA